MREYFTLGSSPADEPCAQVGSDNYSKQMRLETRALINQMERLHPVPADNDHNFVDAGFSPYYACKSFPHDFGNYHEVCAIFDPDHEPSSKWACRAEELFPSNWDAQALKELSAAGYVATVN